MRSLAVLRVAAFASLGVAGAIGLSACVPPHHRHLHHGAKPLVVKAQLDCPESQGWLKRVSVSSDGDSCDYQRDDGEQVTLTRLPLSGQTPQAALAPIEANLKSLLPPRKDEIPPPPPIGSKDKESAHIDVPGVHIDARDDKAEVRVLGVTIDADNDKANVHAGLGADKANVSADENGAEVRAADIDNVNANIVLILASEKPGPSGLHAVGYIAKGPVAGPLVVAQFKSRERHSGNIDDDRDLRRLIELNVSR